MIAPLLIGLAAFWITGVVRRLPKIENLVLAEVKPFSCNACMSFWSVLAVTAILVLSGFPMFPIITYIAGSGVCLLLLETLDSGPAPILPPPDDHR